MSNLLDRFNKWAEDNPSLGPWVVGFSLMFIMFCGSLYFSSPPINAYLYCWDRGTDKYYQNGPSPHHFGFKVEDDHLCSRSELMWPHDIKRHEQ